MLLLVVEYLQVSASMRTRIIWTVRMKQKARIIGTGSYVPPKRLTNADLERMLDTSDEWIYSHTGIRERRIADDNTSTSDMAVEAIRQAIQALRTWPSKRFDKLWRCRSALQMKLIW